MPRGRFERTCRRFPALCSSCTSGSRRHPSSPSSWSRVGRGRGSWRHAATPTALISCSPPPPPLSHPLQTLPPTPTLPQLPTRPAGPSGFELKSYSPSGTHTLYKFTPPPHLSPQMVNADSARVHYENSVEVKAMPASFALKYALIST